MSDASLSNSVNGQRPRWIAVVGGGLAGLAAANRLQELAAELAGGRRR